MSKAIEEHMADFLIDQHKLGLGSYCRKCLEFWREHYGPEVATKVEGIIKGHFRKGAKVEKR